MMNQPPVKIREAGMDDMDEILSLWNEMMAEHMRNDSRFHLTKEALAAYRTYVGYHIVSSESCVRVAEMGGRIIGFCLTSISRNLPMFQPERYGYLSDLVVAQGSRRQG